MSLLLRINAALGAVFLIAALVAGYVCWTILAANAQREVLAEAGLMMDSAAAVRAYTSTEILPLISARIKDDPQTQQVFGIRDTPMGRSLYLAKAISAKPEKALCLLGS